MERLQGHRDLRVYQLSYRLALEVFELSRSFPTEERYSLTDQIRRSSRSVAANIAEAFRKRQYPALLVRRLADADAEATETLVWLDFALDCGYLDPKKHGELVEGYGRVGRMIGTMMTKSRSFVPR